MKNKLLFLILTVIAISCSKDELYSYTNEELANDEFYPYLEMFRKEAKKRGYNFDNYNIDFYLADIDKNDAVGLSYGDSRIVIDRDVWNGRNPEFKEFLIFHELGHSALNRKHKNDKTDAGECLSIMEGSDDGNYQFTCSSNIYSSLWREYYLDELFNSNTSLPNWYLDSQDYDIEDLNKDIINSRSDVAFHIDSIDLDTISNFVLEIKFNTTNSSTNTIADFMSLISLNGYTFNASQYADNKRITIFRVMPETTQHIYENGEYDFNENVKITIKKNQNLLSFFIDEQFLHAMDIDAFQDTDIITSVDSETNREIVMDIEIFQYD
ncbi:hypothetical protein [Zunongwangia sp. H14]|uniref:hypothetical protein n=1 Tax=Zunongwangia sp. H14 TaxID=3240792 RepID=UPI003565AC2F